MIIVNREISELQPYARNARTHSKKQITQIANSFKQFGINTPVLTTENGQIIAGHGRVAAAKQLGLTEIPTVVLSHLSDIERRAFILADNKIALNAGYDRDLLASELGAIAEHLDLEITGFSLAEAEILFQDASDADPTASDDPEDRIPEVHPEPVTRPGDIWNMGRHRLICGDSRDAECYHQLLGDERADMVFTDPPYNVPIKGHVSGLGKVQHDEFAFAVGDMSEAQFTEFLAAALGLTASHMRDGAIAYVFMDWRHVGEVLAAGKLAFTKLMNLIVWNKGSGSMGTFYRSQHELLFVFKQGSAAHTNSFGLGETGRYRTNVWDYPGLAGFSANRTEELAMHPTVKPVALVADAMRDCSKRGQIILDVFGGSGSTVIAAEKTGRAARMIEFDSHYCDVIVARWEQYTGKTATLIRDGRTYDFKNGADQ